MRILLHLSRDVQEKFLYLQYIAKTEVGKRSAEKNHMICKSQNM